MSGRCFCRQPVCVGYKNRDGRVAWYNPDTQDWKSIEKKGELPPWNIDAQVCYDSKRDRLYIAGGGYPRIEFKPGDSVLWMFDVKTETFSRLVPQVTPTPTSYPANHEMFLYDSVNDVVLLFYYRPREGEKRPIYAYHPETNEWKVVAEDAPQLKGPHNPTWTGHYNPVFNAVLLHSADDSGSNGTMWAYGYQRK